LENRLGKVLPGKTIVELGAAYGYHYLLSVPPAQPTAASAPLPAKPSEEGNKEERPPQPSGQQPYRVHEAGHPMTKVMPLSPDQRQKVRGWRQEGTVFLLSFNRENPPTEVDFENGIGVLLGYPHLENTFGEGNVIEVPFPSRTGSVIEFNFHCLVLIKRRKQSEPGEQEESLD